MCQVERDECRLGLEHGMRKDEVRCFGITLEMSAYPHVCEESVSLRRSIGVGQSRQFVPGMEIVAYVELSIRRPIAKSFALSLNRTHWRIREASTDGTAHYAETFEMSC